MTDRSLSVKPAGGDRAAGWRRILRRVGGGLLWVVLAVALLWAFGALWFDFPVLSGVVAWLLPAAAACLVWRVRPLWKAQLAIGGVIAVIFLWWSLQKPRSDRDWRPDVSRIAQIGISGDLVTIQNVRHCDYRTETDFTPVYETRTVDLRQLKGVDLFACYWGSPYMAHPVMSYDFGEGGRICFSIETRPEKGESYSALGGLYRQFELTVVVADESDVIRLRTNYRKGEDVYLYPLVSSPGQARSSFMEYVRMVNGLAEAPGWYNAVTNNCTTGFRNRRATGKRAPWDWRMLVNGYGDRMLYEWGAIQGTLPFEELKRAAHINPRAQGDAAGFSARIRAR